MKPATRPFFALIVVVAIGLAPASAQMPGNWDVTIYDENEERVPDVLIRLTDPDRPDFVQEVTTDKRGRARILIRNAIVPYTVQLSKPGYQTVTMNRVKVAAQQRTQQNFHLRSNEAAIAAAAAAGAAGSDIDAVAAARGGATDVFNKGVAAYNGGDLDTAEILFLNALEKNPSLGTAYAALGRLYLKKEDYAKAAASAEKAVERDADIDSMAQVLYASYSALGDTEKAEQALAQLKAMDPQKASLNLFNQAAEAYNSGDMANAKSGLLQVLSLNPDHGRANYLIGLVYIGEGDNANAKKHLNHFLEVAPDDPEAATATEMLKYVDG